MYRNKGDRLLSQSCQKECHDLLSLSWMVEIIKPTIRGGGTKKDFVVLFDPSRFRNYPTSVVIFLLRPLLLRPDNFCGVGSCTEDGAKISRQALFIAFSYCFFPWQFRRPDSTTFQPFEPIKGLSLTGPNAVSIHSSTVAFEFMLWRVTMQTNIFIQLT